MVGDLRFPPDTSPDALFKFWTGKLKEVVIIGVVGENIAVIGGCSQERANWLIDKAKTDLLRNRIGAR